MKIPCEDISKAIHTELIEQVNVLKARQINPKLVVVLIADTVGQAGHVKTIKKLAAELGIAFELVHFQEPPAFLQFANKLRDLSHDPVNTAIVIQQPLPSSLQSDTIYNFIPLNKEIEGHKKKTPYLHPLGLTVLSLLKYIYHNADLANIYPDPAQDPMFFKQALKQKKLVLVGRGLTGGGPIARTLSQFKINFINVNSQTYEPEQYFQEADVIISAVGKTVIKSADLKPGVTLINIGQHIDHKHMAGDYDEKDIAHVASYYTPTTGGTGPLEVLFLMKNVVEAAIRQNP